MKSEDLQYECIKCGMCCFEIKNNPGEKRIPLYPDEVDFLIEKAKESRLEFKVIEDLVFPDVLNQKILILTYKIMLNPLGCCPFYDKNRGCTVHDVKPLACQAYPLSLKRIDAFNFQISIDPMCNFVKGNYKILKKVDLEGLLKIFKDEYPKAEKFFRKNKRLMLKIIKLECENKIKIARQISIEDFDKALKDWDRIEFKVN